MISRQCCSSPQIKRKNRFMHKLLFDQNLSYRIIKQLENLFPGSNHVRLLKLEEADDQAIWQYAKEQGFHIITKDIDFNDINALYGFPPKIIRLNIGNSSTKAIIDLLKRKTEIIINFLENEESGILEID